MSPWNSTRPAAWGRSAGGPARSAANRPRTAFTASDEKGFSVSDDPYPITVGISKDLPSEFPGNFVAQTEANEMAVVGLGSFANKAYYRVVAVDPAGNRSGPSEYASAPAAGRHPRAQRRSEAGRGISQHDLGHSFLGRTCGCAS